MKRTELYKKLKGKRVACLTVTRYNYVEATGIFKAGIKAGIMSFTVTHIEPLRRMEVMESKYYLYPDDEIEDTGEYITIRRKNFGLLFIFLS